MTVTNQGSHTEFSLRTNSSGEYNFSKLPSGSYEVLLVAPSRMLVPFKRLKLESVEVLAGKTINLKSQMQVSDTWDPPEGARPIPPPPTTGDIQGVVLVDVGVKADVEVTFSVEPFSSLERRTKTDSEGVYRFIDLRPGKYEIRLNGKEFCSKAVTVKVVVGKTTNLKTRLKSAQLPCGVR